MAIREVMLYAAFEGVGVHVLIVLVGLEVVVRLGKDVGLALAVPLGRGEGLALGVRLRLDVRL